MDDLHYVDSTWCGRSNLWSRNSLLLSQGYLVNNINIMIITNITLGVISNTQTITMIMKSGQMAQETCGVLEFQFDQV